MSIRNTRGFTLMELLIVVAILALISGVGITLYNGALTDSNESVSQSMQRELLNTVNSYYALHGNRLPDGFDSLLRDQVTAPYTGAFTTVGSLEVADDPKDAIYIGYDTDGDNEADPGVGSLGLDSAGFLGYFRSMTVAQLTDSDLATLKSLGITTVYDVSTTRDFFHGNVTYVERELVAGDLVCVIDPRTARNGISIYKDFGVDLSDTDTYERAGTADTTSSDYPISSTDLSDDGRSEAVSTQRFLVFGIGPNCKLIGDRKGGMQEAPVCPVVTDGHYNRYFLVIKMPGGPNDMNAAVAGILDARGNTVRGAKSWATRTE